MMLWYRACLEVYNEMKFIDHDHVHADDETDGTMKNENENPLDVIEFNRELSHLQDTESSHGGSQKGLSPKKKNGRTSPVPDKR